MGACLVVDEGGERLALSQGADATHNITRAALGLGLLSHRRLFATRRFCERFQVELARYGHNGDNQPLVIDLGQQRFMDPRRINTQRFSRLVAV